MSQMAAQRPPYDAWLLWSVDSICNLACSYCPLGDMDHVATVRSRPRLGQRDRLRRLPAQLARASRLGLANTLALRRQKRNSLPHRMAPIEIEPLLRALDRTGLTFRIGFTGGGEPFLIPNIVEASIRLSRKHYISFNTNLTSPRIREITKHVDPERVKIHASLHIAELERTRLLDRFVENYRLCLKSGVSIYAQEVAHPSLLPVVESRRNFFAERGIDLTFGPFKGTYHGLSYPEAYTEEELAAFGLPASARQLFHQKGMVCNAGFNAVTAGPNGIVNPCFDIAKLLGHMYGRIKLQPEPIHCPVDVCTCPLNRYDDPLFRLALAKAGIQEPAARTPSGTCRTDGHTPNP